jgi:predicted TIM-barrel fold metal-dependent hydrolase
MIVDFCAYLGHWPMYQLPATGAADLVRIMDRCGIDLAFVSLVDGIFLLDPDEANARLASLVEGTRDRLLPVGTLNPSLPGWWNDLDVGIEQHGLCGFRLFPNYHAYELDSVGLTQLAQELARRRLPLFLACYVDEERFQHPAVRAKPLTIPGIVQLLRVSPETTAILNNVSCDEALALLRTPDLDLENVFLDINAMDKPWNGLEELLRAAGSDRLVYGSQAPFLYPEAPLALLTQSGIPAHQQAKVLQSNWRTSTILSRVVKDALDRQKGSYDGGI